MSPDMPPACCRPVVEVEIDGHPFPGKLRSCDQLPDGTWSCLVTVELDPGEVRTGRYPSEQLR